ncbi:MAG: 2-oxo acid dehydrogenase subunit E2 [Gammaproteobacteria bacterium]|nr:2-oxo acid dehydrogenase subunit E2 [Gammaproteobacteria bacterium]
MTTTFKLPDLGEGLPEAEIVSWHVSVGQRVKVDELLVSVETAKAVVEVPSPYTGVIARLHAAEGEMVATGAALVDFDEVEGQAQPAADPSDSADARKDEAEKANSDSAEAQQADSDADEPSDSQSPEARSESSTVVGSMPSSDDMLVETARPGSRRSRDGTLRAAPAARKLAEELGVTLAEVAPSGSEGQITPEDVRAHAQARDAARARDADTPGPWRGGALRGPRRAMARSMTTSGQQVVPCTIFDDADIEAWLAPRTMTERLLRAMVAGCRAEPALNGFFDAQAESLEALQRVDIAMAVDTPDGLIVPVIRDAAGKSLSELREAVDRIKQATRARSVRPQDMVDYTITLTNFGMLAGRYATPVLVPPTVAILGAGMLQRDLVPVLGGIEVHRRLPLSLTFDHRCITGGEACRFLAAVIADLQRSS